MNKKDIKYYIFIVLILTVTITVETYKPKPVNWDFTLEQKDKIPYGTYVIYNTLDEIFPGQKIEVNKKTIWEFSKKKDKTLRNFIFISENLNIDNAETAALLNLAKEGNNIFISAHSFGKYLSDTLGFSTKYSLLYDTASFLNLYNKNLKRATPYKYKKSAGLKIFDKTRNSDVELLAFDKDKNPVFFRQKYGDGFFYISCVPETFTNYAVVTEKNYDFAYKMLSYLPVRETVWDEYYKPFKKINKNSLSFLLSQDSLKNAYFLLILFTLLFAFFSAKRKQRVIPVIKPYKNKTLEFVKTISGLYYKSKNHKDIALKIIIFLNSFIKNKYNVNIIDNESVDIEKLSEQTGINSELLKKLFFYLSKINKLENISESQLSEINRTAEKIYEQAK